jgi:hypothetical protein
MANPGYPMQPMQPPMGGPMGPGPYGGPPPGMMRPPQVRQGTSKAVPVVVSAGLAVGVFCGLLFGLGTGDDEVTAAPTAQKAVGDKTPVADDTKPPAGVQPPKSVTDGTGTPAGSAATPATGSATVAKPPPPEPVAQKAKLSVEIKPEAVAKEAKITVDGVEMTGMSFELAIGDATKKEVKVVVEAAGYKDVVQKVEIETVRDTTLQVEMVKKPSRPSRPDRPKRPKRPPGGGGLIDI